MNDGDGLLIRESRQVLGRGIVGGEGEGAEDECEHEDEHGVTSHDVFLLSYHGHPGRDSRHGQDARGTDYLATLISNFQPWSGRPSGGIGALSTATLAFTS